MEENDNISNNKRREFLKNKNEGGKKSTFLYK